MSLIQQIYSLKEELRYNLKAIKEYNKDLKGYDDSIPKIFKENKKEMIDKREKENIIIKEKIIKLNNNINMKLKYFNKDMLPTTKGKVLKILNKIYRIDEKVKPLFEHINYAIETNKELYLQYKILIDNCKKKYNKNINRWITK